MHRVRLNRDFKANKVKDIVDAEVQRLVRDHLAKYGNDSKRAFADDARLYHKKRQEADTQGSSLCQQSSQADKLAVNKLGLKDRQGENLQMDDLRQYSPRELVRDSNNGKVKGHFVTMYEAARRARGVGMPKQAMVRQDHGADQEFLFALHKDDLVSIRAVPITDEKESYADDPRRLYMRVQKFEFMNNAIVLRLHTSATTEKNKDQKLLSVNAELFTKWDLQKHQINVLGKFPDDQAHSRDS